MAKRIPEGSQDTNISEFIERLRCGVFDKSTCFLCARSLEQFGSSEEHIIPRWAQKRYVLWDQWLTLLNRSTIPYRNLTVPCCGECNKYQLQPIETSMSQAVLKGPDAVRQLGLKIIFLWLGKIFYGILYKELFLLLDQASDNGITIATPDLLKQYESHLFFLQQAREKVRLVDFCPGSFFIFRTQKPKTPQLQWDFNDNIAIMFIAIRMGEVGIIGILQDGGAQQPYEESYNDIIDLPLHPIQFRELCAQFSYRSTLATRTPKYITFEGTPHKTFQAPLGGFSLKPLFKQWDPKVYARFLAFHTGYPYEEIFSPPDKVMTWLHDNSGKVKYIDFEDHWL